MGSAQSTEHRTQITDLFIPYTLYTLHFTLSACQQQVHCHVPHDTSGTAKESKLYMLGYYSFIDAETYQNQAAEKEADNNRFLSFKTLETEERYFCVQQVATYERQT